MLSSDPHAPHYCKVHCCAAELDNAPTILHVSLFVVHAHNFSRVAMQKNVIIEEELPGIIRATLI